MVTIDPTSRLGRAISSVVPVDEEARQAAGARQLVLTKPEFALGRLEEYGNQLAAIARQCPPPVPDRGFVGVFAGDHGSATQTSPSNPQVSAQMGDNILSGGAAVNVLSRNAGAHVCLVDVGLLTPLDADTDEHNLTFLNRRIAAGTRDISQGPAMTVDEALQALEAGVEVADLAAEHGYNALLAGEIGIGNTAPAAAIISVFTSRPVAEVTGNGTDHFQVKHARKVATLEQAISVNQPDRANPVEVLAKVGGFEHAATVGFLIGAAAHRLPAILDGVISSAAALTAQALCPAVTGYLFAGHSGDEPGILAALDQLALHPMLHLGMHLGEGTGAAAALPLLQASAKILNDMATFEQANVISEHE